MQVFLRQCLIRTHELLAVIFVGGMTNIIIVIVIIISFTK